jgi:hypothetical protein
VEKVICTDLVFGLFGCAEMQQIANQYSGLGTMGNAKIASGLKEAVNNGTTKEVTMYCC